LPLAGDNYLLPPATEASPWFAGMFCCSNTTTTKNG